MNDMLKFHNVGKDFTLCVQNNVRIPVFQEVNLTVWHGACVGLTGQSGSGKSSLMRMAYGNYLCPQGAINVRHDQGWVDIATASPSRILDIRRRTMGYVSQFLRVIPRVPTLDIVAEPLIALGADRDLALERARLLLERLRIPERLWSLSPLTFSGGEQQRVNIARGFVVDYPVLLLDELTASLDQHNRETVLELINEAKTRGAAVLGIFHDETTRKSVCTSIFDITSYRSEAA